jgi:hypothetical protein
VLELLNDFPFPSMAPSLETVDEPYEFALPFVLRGDLLNLSSPNSSETALARAYDH